MLPARRSRRSSILAAIATTSAAALLAAGCTGTQNPPELRLVTSYDGGLHVLDGGTLRVLDTIELGGFNRLNPAGDGRHVIVSTANAFRLLDTGAGGAAKLTDVSFEASKPGHVVRHAGKTVLFSDGSGRVETFASDNLDGGKPESVVYQVEKPHHGVAVELANGNLVVTLGDDKTRVGVKVLDRDRKEIARSEECPGVHGEATAPGETVVIGCENGVLVYRDGRISKISSPDPYGRIGNQAGSEESPVVLGDYKTDPDAELERPERVSLIDTASQTMRLVNLGTSYTFRSLARGPHGEALVLGTDGAIHVIDPAAATVTGKIPVVAAWSEPMEWQRPRPTLFVRGTTAYVTEPTANKIHAVDLAARKVITTATLPATPNELTGA
jgi:hypothetical protein